jgi:hypothetical protein
LPIGREQQSVPGRVCCDGRALEPRQGHSQQVYPLVTQTFADHLAMLNAGLKTPRDLGERAAIEAIRHTLVLARDERAIFITEDDRLLTGTYVVLDQDRDRMISMRISPKLCASAISRSASATRAANRSAVRPRRPLIPCATRPKDDLYP